MKNPPPIINSRDCCADGEVVVPTHDTPLWIFWGDHKWQDKRFLYYLDNKSLKFIFYIQINVFILNILISGTLW